MVVASIVTGYVGMGIKIVFDKYVIGNKKWRNVVLFVAVVMIDVALKLWHDLLYLRQEILGLLRYLFRVNPIPHPFVALIKHLGRYWVILRSPLISVI